MILRAYSASQNSIQSVPTMRLVQARERERALMGTVLPGSKIQSAYY